MFGPQEINSSQLTNRKSAGIALSQIYESMDNIPRETRLNLGRLLPRTLRKIPKQRSR
jgi:hypothetical protein